MAYRTEVTIVNYGIGNLASVANMVAKAGGSPLVTGDVERIAKADRLILPGVGAFDACRAALDSHNGLEEAIRSQIAAGTPMLGICVGMQLLADRSEEGKLAGLGLIPGTVRRFNFESRPDLSHLRVPHMGWSIVEPKGRASLFTAFANEPARFYFVHSYHFVCDVRADVVGEADYGGPFTAAVERGNVMGVQFHPEKSHNFGMRLLKRFIELA